MPFSALSQSLSFHASPESFISSRLSSLALENPSQFPSPSSSSSSSPTSTIVRASILNRNVHVISSHRLCEAILTSSSNTSSTPPSIDVLQGESPPSAGSAGIIRLVPSSTTARSVAGEDDKASSNSVFAAIPAYKDLMAPFFPPPNLLLSDPPDHTPYKARWNARLASLPDSLPDLLIPRIDAFIAATFAPGETVSVYDAMKRLSWQLLFAVFVPQLSPAATATATSQVSSDHAKLVDTIEGLQETLLRGQFSLFPVALRTPFWSSTRSRGIAAREKLQAVLKKHFQALAAEADSLRVPAMSDEERSSSRCPFLNPQPQTSSNTNTETDEINDVANHVLLFTSSLANKALAALLTACVMNVFLFQQSRSEAGGRRGSRTLADLIRSVPGGSIERKKMVRSIIRETERLSPPVVGVLRRVMKDVILSGQSGDSGETGYELPCGHEAWLYFPAAGRDKTVFGEDAELFRWDRFMSDDFVNTQTSFAFGAGPKTCVGMETSRMFTEMFIERLADAGVELTVESGCGPEPGVRAMLGWERADDVQVFARDLKQLPCQRPRKAVIVRVEKVP